MEGNMAFLTDRSQEKEKKKTQVSTQVKKWGHEFGSTRSHDDIKMSTRLRP